VSFASFSLRTGDPDVSISIPASASLKRRVIVPTTDPGHVAGRAFPPATAAMTTPSHEMRNQQPSTTRVRTVRPRPVGPAIAAPDVPTRVRPQPQGGNYGAVFHAGGHNPSAIPSDFASGGTSDGHASAVRRLHARFNSYRESEPATPATLAEVNVARRHVKQTGCRACGVWLMGVRAGTAGQKQVVTVQQAAQAQAEQQAQADEQMAAKQPERYIAAMARRYRTPGLGPSMAAARVEHTALARAPQQPPANRW
jgi:ribosomal protein L34E